jgi:hypothetical protein
MHPAKVIFIIGRLARGVKEKLGGKIVPALSSPLPPFKKKLFPP